MATPKRARSTSPEIKTRSNGKKAAPQGETSAQPHSVEQLEEAIRIRAYQLWLQRGADHGAALDDWLRAESEIQASVTGSRTA